MRVLSRNKHMPVALAIRRREHSIEIVRMFLSWSQLEDYSQRTTDRDIYIYRLGTDFLVDGHTEGSRRG